MNIAKTLKASPKYFSLMNSYHFDDFIYLAIQFQYTGCPLSCLKCSSDSRNENVSFNPKYLSLKERKNIIDEAKDLGGKAVILAGLAEPLIHMHSKSLIEYIVKQEMIPIVYSNGFELNDEMVRFLKDNGASVAISLDSLNAYKYWTMARPKAKQFPPKYLENIIKNIENCITSFDIEYVDNVKIVRTALIATVTKINEDELVHIKHYFGDDTYFVANPLMKTGAAIENWNVLMGDLTPNPSQHKLIVKKLSESGGPLTHYDGVCAYSNNGLALSPDGRYVTCAYTEKTLGLLGNVKTHSLKEAFTIKHTTEKGYYLKHGKTSCLVRSDSFDSFVDSLRSV